MKVLVTGAAGFIGAALVNKLLENGFETVGIDNINSYYDIQLKYARLAQVGIFQEYIDYGKPTISIKNPCYHFLKIDLTDRDGLNRLFTSEHFDIVVNLAAQAGVRYSIENPYAYLDSNVYGFLNILENCRHHAIKHLIYASSSSIYGNSAHTPNSENDRTDSPVSLYAAMKKSDELMAHAYTNLYNLPTTGLRFFTVYGPWGRPDMAPYKFLKAILNGETINVFNHGNLSRDFTYIDDIIDGMMLILQHSCNPQSPYKIYNIGCSSPVKLMDFIATIEKITGRKAIMNMQEMQPGDVLSTFADTRLLQKDFGYKPKVSIQNGLTKFYDWFRSYQVSKQ